MDNIMEFAEELNQWLIKHLTPISSEADPMVLSKYVIALIQKAPATSGENKEKALRQKCLKQLEIFLGNETTSFVDTLFEVIKSQSFLKPQKQNVSQSPVDTIDGSLSSSAQSSAQSTLQQRNQTGKSSQTATETAASSASVSEATIGQSSSKSASKRSQKLSDANAAASTASSSSSKADVESSLFSDHHSQHHHPYQPATSSTGFQQPSSVTTTAITTSCDVDMRALTGGGSQPSYVDSSNVFADGSGCELLSTSSDMSSAGAAASETRNYSAGGGPGGAHLGPESSMPSSMVSSSEGGRGSAGPIRMVLSHPSSMLPPLEPQHSFFSAQAEQSSVDNGNGSASSSYHRGPSSSSSSKGGNQQYSSDRSSTAHLAGSSAGRSATSSSGSRGQSSDRYGHHHSSRDHHRGHHGYHSHRSRRSRSPRSSSSGDDEDEFSQEENHGRSDRSRSRSIGSPSSERGSSSSDGSNEHSSSSERANTTSKRSSSSSRKMDSSQRGVHSDRRSHSKSGSGGDRDRDRDKKRAPSPSRDGGSKFSSRGSRYGAGSSRSSTASSTTNYRSGGGNAYEPQLPASYRPDDSSGNKGRGSSSGSRHRQTSPSSSSGGGSNQRSSRSERRNATSNYASSSSRTPYNSSSSSGSNHRRRSKDGSEQQQSQSSVYRPQYQPQVTANSDLAFHNAQPQIERKTPDFFDFDRLAKIDMNKLMQAADTTSKQKQASAPTTTTSSTLIPTIKTETASSSVEEDISTAWSDTRHDLDMNFAAASSSDEKKPKVKGEEDESENRLDGNDNLQQQASTSADGAATSTGDQQMENVEQNQNNYLSHSHHPSSTFLQQSSAAFMDHEPYNPEAASIDQNQAMLMQAMLGPGFMANTAAGGGNVGNGGPFGHLPHRFLAAAAVAAAASGGMNPFSGQDSGNHGSMIGGGGGRQRELVGVSLSGGEPYIPRGARGHKEGGRGGGRSGRSSYDHSGNSGGGNHYHRSGNSGSGDKRSSNVINIMGGRGQGGNSNNSRGGHHHHQNQQQISSEIYVPGEASSATGDEAIEANTAASVADSEDGPSSGSDFGLTPNDKTWLLVRKIPPKLNEISIIDKHFSKFGKVVNIKVCYENDPSSALIQFSNTFEATAAIRSTEAIFNNRFIKVYWAYQQLQHQQKEPGQGHKGGGGRGGPPLQSGGFHGRSGAESGTGAAGSGNTNFFKSGTNKWANKHYGGSNYGNATAGIGVGGPLEGRLGDPFFGGDSGAPQGNLYQRKATAAARPTHHQQRFGVNSEGSETIGSESTNLTTTITPVTTQTPTPPPSVSSSSQSATPPLKIISPLERAAKMKELTSASQSLSDALANQKKLVVKMEAAKTEKEKSAIKKLLQLTLKNVTAMKQRVEKLQTDLTPAFRNSKTFNRNTSIAPSAVSANITKSETSAKETSNPTTISKGDDEKDLIKTGKIVILEEKQPKRTKERSTEMDDDNSSTDDNSSIVSDQTIAKPSEIEHFEVDETSAAAANIEADIQEASTSSRKRGRHELSKENSTESVESSSGNSEPSQEPSAAKMGKVTNAVLAASVSVFNDAEVKEEIAEDIDEPANVQIMEKMGEVDN